jgi:hypothetical protein
MIPAGDTVLNRGTIHNEGSFDYRGAIVNLGTIWDGNCCSIMEFPGGTLINNGTIVIDHSSIVIDGALVNNFGGNVILENMSQLVDSGPGTVTNNPGGDIIAATFDDGIENEASLVNAGTIITNLGDYVSDNGGNLTNEAGGTIANGGNLVNYDTLVNDGTITNDAGGRIMNHVRATFSNLGTLDNAGAISNNGTITSSGVFYNSGTMSGSGSFTGNLIAAVPEFPNGSLLLAFAVVSLFSAFLVGLGRNLWGRKLQRSRNLL